MTGSGGILVTHAPLYRGMEAPVVILVTRDPGTDGRAGSNLLRAVAQLVVIADKKMV